jgi:hypothetical protein
VLQQTSLPRNLAQYEMLGSATSYWMMSMTARVAAETMRLGL